MIKSIFLLLISMIAYSSSHAQVYFQYEQANSIKVKKYGIGDVLTYQTSQYPDVWQQGEIIDINTERQSLVFIDRVSYLNEMTYIKYNRPWAYGVGTSLFVFGTSWLVFGGAIEGLRSIGAIETNYVFGWDTAIIGGTAMASGFLTRALWGTAVKKLNDKKRVRIIDLRL